MQSWRLRRVFERRLGTVGAGSGSRLELTREPDVRRLIVSGRHQDVIRPSSGRHQAVIRASSGRHQV